MKKTLLLLISILLLSNCREEHKKPIAVNKDTLDNPSKGMEKIIPEKIEPIIYLKKSKTIYKDSSYKYSTDTISFRDYKIILHYFGEINYYENKEYFEYNNCLEIMKDNRIVYLLDEKDFKENLKYYRNYIKAKRQGESLDEKQATIEDVMEAWSWGNQHILAIDTINYLTYDSIPKLTVWGDTKGMYCCKQLYIFEIGKNFRFVNEIHSANIDIVDKSGDVYIGLRNMDKDSLIEISFWDPLWRYWNGTAGADCPYNKIILEYRNGNFHVDYKMMFKTAPDEKTMNKWIKICRNYGQSIESYSYLWAKMLELIYSGHYSLAFSFLDSAWPPKVKGIEEFRNNFINMFQSIPFSEEFINWGKE